MKKLAWQTSLNSFPLSLCKECQLIRFLDKKSKWISEQNLRQTRRSLQSIMSSSQAAYRLASVRRDESSLTSLLVLTNSKPVL